MKPKNRKKIDVPFAIFAIAASISCLESNTLMTSPISLASTAGSCGSWARAPWHFHSWWSAAAAIACRGKQRQPCPPPWARTPWCHRRPWISTVCHRRPRGRPVHRNGRHDGQQFNLSWDFRVLRNKIQQEITLKVFLRPGEKLFLIRNYRFYLLSTAEKNQSEAGPCCRCRDFRFAEKFTGDSLLLRRSPPWLSCLLAFHAFWQWIR